MEVDNQLPLVTISDSGWHHGLNLYNSGDYKLYQYNEFRSLSGEIDPLQNVKALPEFNQVRTNRFLSEAVIRLKICAYGWNEGV